MKLIEKHCDHTLEFSSWHQGISWKVRNTDTEWRKSFFDDPNIDYHFEFDISDSGLWISEVPNNLLPFIEEFERIHHSFSTYHVLWILSRSTAAIDIFTTTPFLFWMIIDRALTEKLSDKSLLKLFQLKRRLLLESLGFPGSDSALKFLGKFVYENPNIHDSLILKDFMWNQKFNRINHFESFNIDLILFLIKKPHLIKASFIENIHNRDIRKKTAQYIDDITNMSEILSVTPRQNFNNILHCRDFSGIKKLHDNLSKRMNISIRAEELHFPPTHLKPTDHIKQILSLSELKEEGEEMNHCIFSYHEKIYLGEYAAFKVVKPERATLGVKIIGSRNYEIDQIQGYSNSPVSENTHQFVHNWFLSEISQNQIISLTLPF